MTKPVEGEVGTWSHCGNKKPHSPHLHTIVFNEGPYPDVQCHGTPKPQKDKLPEVRKILAEVTATHEGRVSTHFEGCWKYHAGCLAYVLTETLDD